MGLDVRCIFLDIRNSQSCVSHWPGSEKLKPLTVHLRNITLRASIWVTTTLKEPLDWLPSFCASFVLSPCDKALADDIAAPLTKFYYLVQMAFWVQTMIALNIEKKRKDYWQMFAHHVITVLLCTLSYAANWTRVGNLILCIMDMVDILLPVSPSTLSLCSVLLMSF